MPRSTNQNKTNQKLIKKTCSLFSSSLSFTLLVSQSFERNRREENHPYPPRSLSVYSHMNHSTFLSQYSLSQERYLYLSVFAYHSTFLSLYLYLFSSLSLPRIPRIYLSMYLSISLFLRVYLYLALVIALFLPLYAYLALYICIYYDVYEKYLFVSLSRSLPSYIHM